MRTSNPQGEPFERLCCLCPCLRAFAQPMCDGSSAREEAPPVALIAPSMHAIEQVACVQAGIATCCCPSALWVPACCTHTIACTLHTRAHTHHAHAQHNTQLNTCHARSAAAPPHASPVQRRALEKACPCMKCSDAKAALPVSGTSPHPAL